MADWNASLYHQISSPQQTWGNRILEQLQLDGTERALDIGCGTGRLTVELAGRLQSGHIVGVDRSWSMLTEAAGWFQQRQVAIAAVQCDAAALPFVGQFDLAFSTATFHWVPDHPRLFESIHRALKPGGRLVAQCGGGPNLARLYARALELMRGPYARFFDGWKAPWIFADVGMTRRHLHTAGFADIEVALIAAPTTFDGPEPFAEFVSTVCIRPQLARLPPSEHQRFTDALTRQAAADDPPFELDYWRLNIAARRPVRAQ